MAIALGTVLVGCSRSEGSRDASSSASASLPAAPPSSERLWSAIERHRHLERALREVPQARSTRDRRLAARTLARLEREGARPALLQLLADPDPEVIRFAAHGLGLLCKTDDHAVVTALLSRVATLAGDPETDDDTLEQLATALGRCGTPAAEKSLRAWLSGPFVRWGAIGLGHLATRQGTLTEPTIVRLLNLAAEETDSATWAWFPLSRLPRVPGSMQGRLLEVSAGAIPAQEGLRRTLALRAMAGAGPAAATPLGAVLRSDRYRPAERATAAHALGQLGSHGQRELSRSLVELLPKLTLEQLVTPAATATYAALDELEEQGAARDVLRAAAERDIPSDATPAARRRLISIRCRAAVLQAGRSTNARALRQCDPDDGRAGALALVRVLDRGELAGPRLPRFEESLASEDPVVVEAALRLFASHPEAPHPETTLEKMLRRKEPGIVATAAQVLAAYPARGQKAGATTAGIAKALANALTRDDLKHAIETRGAALHAIGALGLLTHKKSVEDFCRSEHAALRASAESALRLMGDPERHCTPGVSGELSLDDPPPFPADVTLRFETDVGELFVDLEAAMAPRAVAALTRLAEQKFYDDMQVHRVVEGFVVQLGDPVGDGFGDGHVPPLLDEKTPTALEAFDVGLATAGRDTATTQFFVTLDRYPHLDGTYTRLGKARGPWDAVVRGDRIRRVEVIPRRR